MFSSLYFKFSPINKFLVKEKSMEPYLKEKDTVLAAKYFFSKPKVEDVIIFRHPAPPYLFIKRITKINKEKVWVEGDNKIKSIDSREFGWIVKKDIIGKVVKKL